MTNRTWYVATLGFVLSACAVDKPEQTKETFDAVRAVADCQSIRGADKSRPDDNREIEGLVRSRRISPEECAEYQALLDNIHETEAMLDDALELRSYVDAKGGAE